MIHLFFDPRFFSWVIMTLYALNAGQYLLRGQYGFAWYWSGALMITAAVTFGLNDKGAV